MYKLEECKAMPLWNMILYPFKISQKHFMLKNVYKISIYRRQTLVKRRCQQPSSPRGVNVTPQLSLEAKPQNMQLVCTGSEAIWYIIACICKHICTLYT